MPNNVRASIELGAQIVIAIAIVVVAGVVRSREGDARRTRSVIRREYPQLS